MRLEEDTGNTRWVLFHTRKTFEYYAEGNFLHLQNVEKCQNIVNTSNPDTQKTPGDSWPMGQDKKINTLAQILFPGGEGAGLGKQIQL